MASLLGDYRWIRTTGRTNAESDGFDGVNRLINNRGTGFYDEDDPLGFAEFKAGVFASMVPASRS